MSESLISNVAASGIVGDPGSASGQAQQEERAQQFTADGQQSVEKGQHWLLFLRHSSACTAPRGSCEFGESCDVVKALWFHIISCSKSVCDYPR